MTEGNTQKREFDPRFNRAFQPGYDPRVHREEPPSVAPRHGPSRPTAPVQPPPVAYAIPLAESLDANTDGVGSAGPVAAPGGASLGTEDAGAERSELEHPDARAAGFARRINPYLIVLWVLGVTFVWVGFAGGSMFADPSFLESYVGPSMFSSFLFQMVLLGAPMMVILGLATLTASVVVLAARWKRR